MSPEAALDAGERLLLLGLARETLRRAVAGEPLPEVNPCGLPPRLARAAGCFVTLTRGGALRGCIGTLEARWPLWRAVLENTVAAALRDRRFAPLRREEVDTVRIEISVLSPLRPLDARAPAERLARLVPGRDGVVLEKQGRRATFLPQVWEKLSDPLTFLEQLALKAGLPPNAWQEPDARLDVYTVTHFAEPETPEGPRAEPDQLEDGP